MKDCFRNINEDRRKRVKPSRSEIATVPEAQSVYHKRPVKPFGISSIVDYLEQGAAFDCSGAQDCTSSNVGI